MSTLTEIEHIRKTYGPIASSQSEQIPNLASTDPVQTHTRIQIRLAMARRLREKLDAGLFAPEQELEVIQTIEKLTRVGEKGLERAEHRKRIARRQKEKEKKPTPFD